MDIKPSMNDNLNIDDTSKGIMATVVRIIGMVLLLAGLWVAFEVLFEAWDLYEQPQKIERFADAIEKGSNIDKSLVSLRESVISGSQQGAQEGDGSITIETRAQGSNVRVSYFIAWVIVILLLLLIARIALGAVKTGGELVLFDMQIKQFAKMLVRESSKTGD